MAIGIHFVVAAPLRIFKIPSGPWIFSCKFAGHGHLFSVVLFVIYWVTSAGSGETNVFLWGTAGSLPKLFVLKKI